MIPADAELTARPEEIPAWDDTPDEMKPVLARQMEVYAGFLEHTDHHVGRLIDALDELEILDDTLIYVIIGDNGASAEGTPNGCFNELVILNGAFGLETPEFMTSRIADFGGPKAYNHYAVGWAHAMDTPYQWTKQVASHWGGTRNGTIVHWPKGIKAKGEVRTQFHHVIDVAADRPRRGRPARAHVRPRHPADAAARRHDGVLVRRSRRAERARRSTSRCSATAASTTRAGQPSPATASHGCAARDARIRRRRLGAVRPGRLDAGARPVAGAAGEAPRPAAPVPDRGGEVQRPAARRSPLSSASTPTWRDARS